MWILKVILFVSVFGLLDSYAGPKNYGFKVYKHVITVSEVSLEHPFPDPSPIEEEEMAARGMLK